MGQIWFTWCNLSHYNFAHMSICSRRCVVQMLLSDKTSWWYCPFGLNPPLFKNMTKILLYLTTNVFLLLVFSAKSLKLNVLISQQVEGDGNDFNTLPPGEQVRVCKKNIKTFEQQVQQLKSARLVCDTIFYSMILTGLTSINLFDLNLGLVGSIGWALAYCEAQYPWPDHHSGS